MPPQPFTYENRRGENELVAGLASEQHGVVSRSQLVRLGVSPERITHWRNIRRLLPVHRGVYAFGHSPATWRRREMAAILSRGEPRSMNSVVSHSSAAMMLEIIDYPPAGSESVAVEITVTSGCPKRPGIDFHRSRHLDPRDVRWIDGIPVTSPARTLLDLADSELSDQIGSFTNTARAKRLVTPESLRAVLERYPCARGRNLIRQQLEEQGFTRSKAEEELLGLIRSNDLPIPEVNAKVLGYEVDFWWPEYELVVEVDGFTFHSSNVMFERDKVKEGTLKDADLAVIRVSWKLVTEQPATVIRWIRNEIRRRQNRRVKG